jgi:hypothetical protein
MKLLFLQLVHKFVDVSRFRNEDNGLHNAFDREEFLGEEVFIVENTENIIKVIRINGES